MVSRERTKEKIIVEANCRIWEEGTKEFGASCYKLDWILRANNEYALVRKYTIGYDLLTKENLGGRQIGGGHKF